jgi:PAS domain S-box-containing protein
MAPARSPRPMEPLQGRRCRRLITLFVIGICLHGDLFAQNATDSRPKRVLALHVVRRDSPGFDDTFRSALERAMPGQLDYYSEFIDLNRVREAKYQSALSAYLRSRYIDDPTDLVIASGPSVVEFLNRDPTLFEGVPIVFTTRPGIVAGPLSTGIVSPVEFTNSLEAALRAQPNTQQVFVVSGVAPFDRLYAELFKAQCDKFEGRVTFSELAGLPLAELQERVGQLPPHSIIFYLSLSDDGAGRTFMPLDALDPITAAANAPVYSWHEDAMGHGIVGGWLHSSIRDAEETAQIALRVLRGENPDTIPVITFDSYAYQFDWRQLRRWRIDEARLPPGSIIRFRQQSFFQQHRPYVVGGGLVFAAQALLIGGLLIQRHRRRRAEDALRNSEARNSAILRAIPDLMFVLDRDGRYVDFHARDQKSLFVSPDAFLGRTVQDVMPAPLADRFMQALDKTRTSDEAVVVDYELPMGNEVRYYEARLVPGDHGRVVSIVRDRTEQQRATELNRALAGRLIVSQEEERQRIARELHDDVSQKIALLNLEVDQMAHQTAANGERTRLEKVSSQVSEIADDLSDLSHKLHPSRLHTLGLIESVRLLCDEISHQRQVNVIFDSAELPSVDPNVSLCLYRIAQEALHNIAKHSQARDASVQLTHDGNHVHLQIADSGVGFDPVSTEHGGLGLVSMRERVGVLKGNFVIHAAPGQGTCIGVRVPLIPPRDVNGIFTSE